jgi:hypothetical protein
MPKTQIPISRSTGIVTFNQLFALSEEFKIEAKVSRLFANSGSRIIKLAKPIITKHATDSSGRFTKNWRMLSSTQRATLVRFVSDAEPRLEGVFEGEWATDWVLKKLIDQRVSDAKRSGPGAKKRKRKDAGKEKKSKLVIIVNNTYYLYTNHMTIYDSASQPKQGFLQVPSL